MSHQIIILFRKTGNVLLFFYAMAEKLCKQQHIAFKSNTKNLDFIAVKYFLRN